MANIKDKLSAFPESADDVYVNSIQAPNEISDAGSMTAEAMQKMVVHHQKHNHTETRDKFIQYWKQQIAFKIILEGGNDE